MPGQNVAEREEKERLSGQAERIGQIIDQVGGVQKAAQILGANKGTLYKWRKGEARVPLNEAAVLAAVAGVSLDWVATGRDRYDLKGFTPIPRFDISPAGVLVEVDGTFSTPLGLRADWLDDLGMKPGDAALVAMRGDAMAPTLRDGALLVIDRGWKTIRGDGVYAFSTGGGFVVRRAQAMVDGSLQINADNPAYQPQMVPASGRAALHVEGRVRAALVTL